MLRKDGEMLIHTGSHQIHQIQVKNVNSLL